MAWRVDGSGRADIRGPTYVVRLPIKNSGRRNSYRSEQLIGSYLCQRGHPVATWTVVAVDDLECSVGQMLPGAPISYDTPWTAGFAKSLAMTLSDLHAMPASGFGPLADRSDKAEGTSSNRLAGLVDRWFHARVWPFDDKPLDTHSIMERAPALGSRVAPMISDIIAAERGRIGVVHSDLHRDHLLVDSAGSLRGVLDFGDAFIGAVAWDFAMVNWYYGSQNAGLLATYYPDSLDELHRGQLLSVAVGLYKAAKNPDDQAVLSRLERCVSLAERVIDDA